MDEAVTSKRMFGWPADEFYAELRRLWRETPDTFTPRADAWLEAYRQRFGLASEDEAWRHLMGDPYIWIDPFEGRG